VEAPTAGSVLLAGILLKMGGYGMLRFVIGLLPQGTNFFKPLVILLVVIGLLYSGLATMRQMDMKRVIAYSSVLHMNFCLLGIVNDSPESLFGAIYLMYGHGFISPALFILVGQIYSRNGTRNLQYQSNVAFRMPLFAFNLLMLSFSNISFPGTANFWSEVLILTGLFPEYPLMTICSLTAVLANTIYMIRLVNKILYGSGIRGLLVHLSDLNKREFFIVFPYILVIMGLGLFPEWFMELHKGWVYFIFLKLRLGEELLII
jgi:NADH-quinone oxidoreductase subunit M